MTTTFGKYFAEGPPGFLQIRLSVEAVIRLLGPVLAQADKAKAGNAALADKNCLLLFMIDSSSN
jgi:hypothetical protein